MLEEAKKCKNDFLPLSAKMYRYEKDN